MSTAMHRRIEKIEAAKDEGVSVASVLIESRNKPPRIYNRAQLEELAQYSDLTGRIAAGRLRVGGYSDDAPRIDFS